MPMVRNSSTFVPRFLPKGKPLNACVLRQAQHERDLVLRPRANRGAWVLANPRSESGVGLAQHLDRGDREVELGPAYRLAVFAQLPLAALRGLGVLEGRV